MKSQKAIGEKIQKIRQEKKLTQEELAEKADVPYPTLIKIESNQVKNPTIKTVKKLAKALEVSIDYLSEGGIT